VKDTLKGILIALILVAALILMLIWIGNLELSGFSTSPPGDGVVFLPPTEEPDDEEDIYDDYDDPDNADFDPIEYISFEGDLELPVSGSTGWAATNLTLRKNADASSERITNLSAGDAFTIFEESGEWWFVRLPDETSGWVEIRKCFINLPDVLPSIFYFITNAESSEFKSSGISLPGITHNSLYSAYSYNGRLGYYEYIVPGLYSLAKALYKVQQLALRNDETLIIYEVFRPRSTQRAVAAALNRLMSSSDPEYNETVYRAIADSQWSVGNFISQGRSNHQLGAAVDSSIGKVTGMEEFQTGEYLFYRTFFEFVKEPSPIHELSPRAVLPARNSAAASTLGDGVWNMKSYFERTGFRALRSEWWHFNHTDSISIGSSAGITGDFFTPEIHSIPPHD